MSDHGWRVVIADDHAVTRAGVRLIVESLPDVEVVGEASTGTDAVRIVLERRPNLVLMDVAMPEMDGIEAIRRLRREMPELAILVLTVQDGEQTISEAMRAGASGFLSKASSLDEIASVLKQLAGDGVYFTPAVAAKLLHSLLERAKDARAESPIGSLITKREREIIALLSQGLSARSIAYRLGIGERTVNTHIGSIYRKMNVNNRVDAVREAMRIGLVEVPR